MMGMASSIADRTDVATNPAASFVPKSIYALTSIDSRQLFERMAQVIVACCYTPVVILVLTRAKVGRVPGRLERASNVMPAWLRGSPTW